MKFKNKLYSFIFFILLFFRSLMSIKIIIEHQEKSQKMTMTFIKDTFECYIEKERNKSPKIRLFEKTFFGENEIKKNQIQFINNMIDTIIPMLSILNFPTIVSNGIMTYLKNNLV